MEPLRALEFEKIGINLPATVLLGGAAALGGLSIWDYIRSRGMDEASHKITTEFNKNKISAKEYMKDKIGVDDKPAPGIDKPVDVITTKKDLQEAFKKSQEFRARDDETKATKVYLKDLQKNVEKYKDNAYAYPGEDRYMILTPEKVNKRVLDHEMGHVKDWASGAKDDPGVGTRMLSVVWKPTYKKFVMRSEEAAWKHAKTHPNLTMRREALKTYSKGFHARRGGLATAGAVLSGALGAIMLGATMALKGKAV